MTDHPDPMYGVWLPGEGWLRNREKTKTFADYNIDIARQVAKCVGRGAKVRYIDDFIEMIESRYLDKESRTLWQSFSNFFNNKRSSSSSSR